MEIQQNRRVLVVDDNRIIHEDFRKILCGWMASADAWMAQERQLFGDGPTMQTMTPFEVDSAFQGQEGFDLVAQARTDGRPYAVTFVDMRMPPGWDGMETIERIWQIDPELQFVICSAYSDHSLNDILMRLGVSDRLLLLKKPCDAAEILLMAATLCEKWRLAHSRRDALCAS